MLLAALPNERGKCRVVGLDARREGGGLRVALLLSDGGCPAGDAPAVLWLDEHSKEELVIRLPTLEDGMYADEFLEITPCP